MIGKITLFVITLVIVTIGMEYEWNGLLMFVIGGTYGVLSSWLDDVQKGRR